MNAPFRACLAVALFVFAWAAPSAHAAAPEHVPRELIVKYRAGTSSAERDQVRQAAGVRPAGIGDGRTQRDDVLGGQTTDQAATKLKSDPTGVHAAPDYRATPTHF